MIKKDKATIFSALVTLPHEHLKVASYEDTVAMAHHARADLESKIARQIREEVISTIAHGAGMDSRTFVDFIQFLSEDPELQARFTGWRAKRRLTE